MCLLSTGSRVRVPPGSPVFFLLESTTSNRANCHVPVFVRKMGQRCFVLTVYRRHRSKCSQRADRLSMKCRCSLWAKGALEGEPYQKSLKTRSYERAQQIIREIEDGTKAVGRVVR